MFLLKIVYFQTARIFAANPYDNLSQHQANIFVNCKILSFSCGMIQECFNTPIIWHDAYLKPLKT